MTAQVPANVPPIDDWNQLLANKVAVVTGGGDGIGGAIARLFAQHGAQVEIAEIDPTRAEACVDAINGASDIAGRAHAHVIDVRDDGAVGTFRDAVVLRHNRVDVLVNNVGDYRPLVRFAESNADSWHAMYEVNLRHLFSVTHAFLPAMIASGGGSIVNLHSVEGTRGFPGEPVYAAMKAGATHFTTSLAAGYGRKGIRCNGIAPDLTQTPQVDYLTGYEEHDHLWEAWAPVGRLGWPMDTARVALFLASDLSAFVTGHNIAVDGGSLSQSGWFYSPDAGRFVNRPKGL